MKSYILKTIKILICVTLCPMFYSCEYFFGTTMHHGLVRNESEDTIYLYNTDHISRLYDLPYQLEMDYLGTLAPGESSSLYAEKDCAPQYLYIWKKETIRNYSLETIQKDNIYDKLFVYDFDILGDDGVYIYK